MKHFKLDTGIEKINSKVEFKLDDLNNVLVDNMEEAEKVISDKGFDIEGTLRNQIVIGGNGLKKSRIIEVKSV